MSALQHFMLDIETLGTQPDSAIFTIGCAAFNLEKIGSSAAHYTRVNVASCEAIGLRMYWDTVQWWLNQSDPARREVADTEGTVSIYFALQRLAAFIAENTPADAEPRIWANDPDFDCVILRTAYDLACIETPWKFWQTRSVRTVLETHGYNKKMRTQHHALNDALIQAQAVQEALNPSLFMEVTP